MYLIEKTIELKNSIDTSFDLEKLLKSKINYYIETYRLMNLAVDCN